jgi:acetyl-CoA acyltransferase
MSPPAFWQAHPVFVVDSVRSVNALAGGGLANVRPDELLAAVLQTLWMRQDSVVAAVAPSRVGVIAGCANQAGEDCRNVARQAALLAGLPVEVSAVTVNRLCGGGMDAVQWGALQVASGQLDVVIAAGVESSSRAPWVQARDQATAPVDSRIGWRFTHPELAASSRAVDMPEVAARWAAHHQVSRAHQEVWAYWSHQKASAFEATRRGTGERVSVATLDCDEPVRPGVTLSSLARLRGYPEATSPLSLATMMGVYDGAGAVLLVGPGVLSACRSPVAQITGMVAQGLDPLALPTALGVATRGLGETFHDDPLILLGESFAVGCLAWAEAVGWLPEGWRAWSSAQLLETLMGWGRVNPRGGSLALGGPMGAYGVQLVGEAFWRLQDHLAQRAVVMLSVGVGQAMGLTLAAYH